MARIHRRGLKFLFLVTFFLSKTENFVVFGDGNGAGTTATWAGSKYQIECTMCAACDNPCNTPSPPPPSSASGTYYYPPPQQTPFSYYQPPPAYRGGGTYYNPPQIIPAGPAPPPPNPIMSYFPYYFHDPQASSSPPLKKATAFIFPATAALFSTFIFL